MSIAFVNQRAVRQARHVKPLAEFIASVANRVLGAAADDVKLALEREVVR